jgi:predicted dehydrogenase
LKAGKHVLLEKPFALTAPDCDGMIAAAKASGRILMLAHVCRFWGEYVSLVEFVQSGRLGKPLSVNASRLSQLPAWADWFLDPALSGGAVLDLSVHDFDIVNWVLGTPKTAYGRGHEYRPGLWNDIHAEIDYGGANGFVEGSEFMPEGYPFSCSLRVTCEGGVAEFAFRAGGVSVEMGGGSTLMVYEPGKAWPLTPKPGDAYQNQTDTFVACVREGRQPTLGTPEQARLAVRTANAVRESFETGKVVAI